MGDYFVCSKTDPVVETKAGKVRGFRLNTTYAFHGIHYAEADGNLSLMTSEKPMPSGAEIA